MDPFLLLVAVIIVGMTLLWWGSRSPPNFPPGPPHLPIVGSLPFLPKLSIKPLVFHISKKYGPVASFYRGPLRSVIISDLQLLKEAFKMEGMTGRFMPRPFNEARFGGTDGQCRGLLMSAGSEWVEQRRFALRTLRDFGFGKKSMEEIINNEVLKLCNELEKASTLPKVSLNSRVNISILNALWAIISGQNFDLNDPQLLKVVEIFDETIRNGNRGSLLVYYFPNLAKHIWSGYKSFRNGFDSVLGVISPAIKEHEENFDSNSMRDFIDVYLNEIANTTDPGSSFHGEHGKKSLIASVIDLFVAGSETTSNSLLWILLYMMKYPEVQAKIHAEIDSQTNDEEMVTLDHEVKLPYTKAVILESMRIVTLVPCALPHHTTSDITLAGYNIPKDTHIYANIYAIHFDTKLWKDPNVFMPERFLSDDGKQVINADRMIAFSVGKRECLGKTLAEKEFFLFFTNIMHKFSFHQVEGQELPSLDMKDDKTQGLVRSVPFYDMKIKMRI